MSKSVTVREYFRFSNVFWGIFRKISKENSKENSRQQFGMGICKKVLKVITYIFIPAVLEKGTVYLPRPTNLFLRIKTIFIGVKAKHRITPLSYSMGTYQHESDC